MRSAERGVPTLVVSADPAHSLGDVLGCSLSSDPKRVAAGLDALEIDARSELNRHWGAVRDYLVSLFRYQGIEEIVAEELALIPGAEELVTLIAVDDLARSTDYGAIVVDCAPTDSTLRLLTLPEVAHSAVRILLRVQRAIARVVTPLATAVLPVPLPEGRVFREAERLLYETLQRLRERLLDSQTTTRLVTTSERMVIDEARRAYRDLSLFEMACDAVVMNRMLPDSAREESFFKEWVRLEAERREEIENAFAPLSLLTAPLQEDEVVGLEALSRQGQALFGERDPIACLSESAPLRFESARRGYRVQMPLPSAAAEELEVSLLDGELLVRAGHLRRSLLLPKPIAEAVLGGAQLSRDLLTIEFVIDPDRDLGRH